MRLDTRRSRDYDGRSPWTERRAPSPRGRVVGKSPVTERAKLSLPDKKIMRILLLLAVAVAAASCTQASAERAKPIYNKDTGRLEQLVSDRNGDGKIDTRAVMDGVRFKSIEIDRNGDGQPDRWEYYQTDAKNQSVLA